MIELKEQGIRIRRLDPKNLVIERSRGQKSSKKAEEQWKVVGYYGKVEDLAHGLVNMLIDVPQAGDLTTQVKLLRQEVRNLEKSLCEQLKAHHYALATQSGQSSEGLDLEPAKAGHKYK